MQICKAEFCQLQLVNTTAQVKSFLVQLAVYEDAVFFFLQLFGTKKKLTAQSRSFFFSLQKHSSLKLSL